MQIEELARLNQAKNLEVENNRATLRQWEMARDETVRLYEAETQRYRMMTQTYEQATAAQGELDKLIVQMTSLEQITVKAIEAKEKVEKAIGKESQTAPAVDKAKMDEFIHIADASRTLYARIGRLKSSNAQLANEIQSKTAMNDDLNGQLQESRKTTKEIEESLTKSSQELFKKLSEGESKMKSLTQTHTKELAEAAETVVDAQTFLSDIKLVLEQATLQHRLLETELVQSSSKLDLSVEQQKLADLLGDETQNIKSRFEVNKDLIVAQFNIAQANSQNELLLERLKEINEDYHTNYRGVQEIISHIGDFASAKQDLESVNNDAYQTQLELRKREKELIVEEEATLKAHESLSLEEQQMNIDIEQEKKWQNAALIEEYDKLAAEIADLRNQNSLHTTQIAQEQAATTKLQSLMSVGEGVLKTLHMAGGSQSAIDSAIVQFNKQFADQTCLIYENMLNQNEESMKNFITQTDSRLAEIAKLMGTIRRKTAKQDSQHIKSTESADDSTHGGEDLAKYRAEEIAYSHDGSKFYVDTASYKNLIRLLFFPTINVNSFYHQHVFAWHNSMTPLITITDELNSLILDFKLGKENFGSTEKQNGTELIARTIQYFEIWLHDFPRDFVSEQATDLLAQIDSVVTPLVDLAKDINAEEELQQLVTIQKNMENLRKKPLQPNTPVQKPIFDLNLKIDQSQPLCLMADTEVIARHFLYSELVLYNNIERYEFIKCGWSKPNREKLSPNLLAYTAHFNKTSRFIILSVLAEKNLKKRAKILTAWIETMNWSYKLHNFMLIFEIDGAMTNPTIKRLKQTWAIIPKETNELYKKLSSFTAPFQKFGKYKQELKQLPVNITLPYLGPWLTDMTYADEGHPTKKSLPGTSGEEGLNFTKQRLYYIPVLYLMQDWGTQVEHHISEQLLGIVKDLKMEDVTDEQLFALSRACE